MNDGIKILLARMETHPEEFVDGLGIKMSKWGALLAQYREYLDEADLKILAEAYKPLMQQHFTELVMAELLDPHEDAQQELSLNPYNTTGSVTLSTTPNQILHGSITYTSEPLVNKKPTTTGKLFNYT